MSHREDINEQHAALLGALANAKRLQILKEILDQETSVGDLARKLGLSQSALSQHLSRLRALELVSTRRVAQTIYYTSRSIRVRKILATLAELQTGARVFRAAG